MKSADCSLPLTSALNFNNFLFNSRFFSLLREDEKDDEFVLADEFEPAVDLLRLFLCLFADAELFSLSESLSKVIIDLDFDVEFDLDDLFERLCERLEWF